MRGHGALPQILCYPHSKILGFASLFPLALKPASECLYPASVMKNPSPFAVCHFMLSSYNWKWVGTVM